MTISTADYERLRQRFVLAKISALERRQTEYLAVGILGPEAAIAITEELHSDAPNLDALLERLGVETEQD